VNLVLADDDLLQRTVLARVLIRAGYRVKTVTNGSAALDAVLTGQYPFLITDWDMPGLDGAAVCRAVRAAKLPDYVYILMLTGYVGEAELLTAFEAGADDYVRKPASEPELLARVKAGCRLIDAERSLRDALAQVQRLSITDSLTGVYNRRYLNDQLPREIERAHRYGRALTIIMADLDGFKQLNDTHGHAVGDEVLKSFASRVQSLIRASADWVARYGGEEFVVVLPETTLEYGTAVAEKIRQQCNVLPLSTASGPHRVTASFGVAATPSGLMTPITAEEMLRDADAALYTSKHAGRNCVTRAVPPSDSRLP
jgi:two-component system, cell cycle response regulator